MKDFWFPKSGKYAGYARDEDFYNSNGKHVGIFRGDILHSSKTGRPIAKSVQEYYLAKHTNGPTIGIYSRVDSSARNLGSRGCIGGYEDPDLS